MRNGAGTDLCESSDSRMPSQLSNISAIERKMKAKKQRNKKILICLRASERVERKGL